jgi:hypothetical protein
MVSTLRIGGAVWSVPGGEEEPPPGDGTAATFVAQSGKGYTIAYPWTVPSGLATDDVLYIALEAPDNNPRTLTYGGVVFDRIIDTEEYYTGSGRYWTVLRGRVGASVPANFTITNGIANDSGVAVAYRGVGDLADETVDIVYRQNIAGASLPATSSGVTVLQDNTIVLGTSLGVGVGTDAQGGSMSGVGIVGWPKVGREQTSYCRFYEKEWDAGPTGNLSFYPFDDNNYRDIILALIQVPPTVAPTSVPTQVGSLVTKANGVPYPIAAPTGLADGDTVFITVSTPDSDVTARTLTGFTPVVISYGIHTLHVLMGTISGTPPANFSPVGGVTADEVAHCVAFRGGDLTSAVFGTPYEDQGVGLTNVPLPGITVAEDNSLVLAFTYFRGSQGTAFESLINIGEASGFYTGIGIAEFDSGATGTIDVIPSAGGQYNPQMGFLMALPPG